VAGGEIMGYNTNRQSREEMKVNNDLQNSPNKGKPFAPLLPLALLMDDISASSSEMLALAVRDFKLGPLIGTKTAGALGHTAAYPLGDGSAISVTVDEYESRGGEKVNGIGVTPDITVERSIDDLVAGRDPQLKSGVEYLEKLVAKKNP
jgi:carboxyl-terminal processing protease